MNTFQWIVVITLAMAGVFTIGYGVYEFYQFIKEEFAIRRLIKEHEAWEWFRKMLMEQQRSK